MSETVSALSVLPRRVLVAIALLALCWIAWRVFSLGAADVFQQAQPERALTWRSDVANALILAADPLSTKPATRNRAEALAQRAIRLSPLDGRSYRVLAQIAESRGDAPRALALYQIAARHSPRDLRSHVWLANHYLRSDTPEAALPHLDAMLRVQPGSMPILFPQLVAFASHARTQPALAALLAADPPWRWQVLTKLCREAKDPGALTPFIEDLRKLPGGIHEDEMAVWLDRLVADRRWGQAYLLWVAQLPPERRKVIGNVFDGGFESEPSNEGFDWRFGQVQGARIDLLPITGAGGERALRVAFEDQRVPFNHVRQLLALPPGAYRMTGRARAEDLRNERGLVWTLRCAEQNKPLASSEPVRGNSGWRDFSLDFSVPAQDCGGQWLQLSLPARIRAEQRIGGRVWYDDLSIARIDPAAYTPPSPP